MVLQTLSMIQQQNMPLTFATAITSNGLAVIDNYRFASEQYDAWKASDDGTFPSQGIRRSRWIYAICL